MASKIYLVTSGVDNEGEVPRGCYSTMQKAVEEANKLTPENCNEDDVNVYVVEVDYDHDYSLPCVWSKRIASGKMIIGRTENETSR